MNPDRNSFVTQVPVVHWGIRLRDNVLALFKSIEIDDFFGQPATAILGFFDFAVWCLDKPIIIQMGVGSQVRDQADVRPLRRGDRTQPTIVNGANRAPQNPLARGTARQVPWRRASA